MKRPIQHIIEEESRKQFAFLIPDGWVLNDFTKDYGKDIHVEIFRNYLATGNIFICQLKGSAQTITNDKIEIQIEVEVLRYYQTIPIPVLLVFYSTKTKQFWAVWANYLLDSFKIKPKQKTVKVSLNSKHFIGKSFFENLTNNFVSKISKRLNVIFSGNSEQKEVIQVRILKWLAKYFYGFYEINNYHLPVTINITINDRPDFYDLAIELPTYKLSLEAVPKKDNVNKVFRPVISEMDLLSFEAEILYLFSSIFSDYSPKISLDVLAIVLPFYKGAYKNKQSLLSIGKFAVESGLFAELQKLIDISIKSHLIEDFKILNFSLFVNDKERKMISSYCDNLVHAINTFPNDATKADLSYNLANYYRYNHEYHQSSELFQKTRRLSKSYLEKYHWWQEYAGVLYLSGHFKIAEAFYRRSIDLDKKSHSLPLTYALIADCLFRQTKFLEASEILDLFIMKVIEIDKMPSYYHSFLYSICLDFEKSGYQNTIVDAKKAADLHFIGVEKKDIDLLKQAIKFNPLNPSLWFNMGIIYGEQKLHQLAYNAFLASALIYYNNKESWLQCWVLQNLYGEPEIAYAIFTHMILIFNDSILNDISDIIVNHTGLTQTKKMETIAAYKYLLDVTIKDIIPKIFVPEKNLVRVEIVDY